MNQLTEVVWPGELIISGGSGQVFKVLKVNQKNYRCLGEDGKQWNVRIIGARKAPEGTPFNAPAPPPEPELPKLVLGSTVRFTGTGAHKFPGIYVLIAHPQRGSDRGRFAKLGGDGDRYVRASLAGVEPVTV